jgi:DNA-binding SARP family transcriptional activator
VEYRILGSLEVLEDGRRLDLGRLKERVVLAVLLLHANEFVSRERLVDELWGAAPPPTARQAVNVYISKLRKTLSRDGDDPIATAEGGYRFRVDGDRLDAVRARTLLSEAQERMAGGDTASASERLQEALALWNGPTLAGLQLESFGRDEVAQLDELRLSALMDRIDCDLAQGRHERVLGELQVLVREHPLRERLRAQQMLALYRADRQADALEAYRETRHSLIDELGIEPSDSLQRLQQAILRHDAALGVPAGTAAVNGEPAALTPRLAPLARHVAETAPRRLPRASVTAVAVVVVAAAAVAAFVSTRAGGARHHSSPVSSVSPNTVAALDPVTGAQVADSPGELKPGPMALVAGKLWVVGRGNASIARFDVRTRRGMPPLQPGPAIDDIAADANGHAWISEGRPVVTWIGHVIDGAGAYGRPVVSTERIAVPLPGAGAEAVGGGFLWVISDVPGRTGESVSLIDARNRRVHSTIPLGRETTAITYGYGAAWIGAYDRDRSTAWLLKVQPGSRRVESLKLETGDGAGPFAIAAGDRSLWVVTSRGSLMRIDPHDLRIVLRIAMVAQQPTALAVGRRFVWTANHGGYSVSQIDARAEKIVRTLSLGRYDAVPCGILATRDAVFVAFGDTTCS